MANSRVSYAASSIQRQFWTAQQLDPQSTAYTIVSAFLIRDPFDSERFLACVRRLVAEHEILRSSFALVGDELRQIVSARADYDLTRYRLAEEMPMQDSVALLLKRESSRPFDLEKGPLVRVMLGVGGCDAPTALLIAMHHIVIDLRTKDLFGKMLDYYYHEGPDAESYASDAEADDYSEYSKWQLKWLESEAASKALEYWKTTVGDANTYLPVQTDRQRSGKQTFFGGLARRCLGSETTGLLAAFHRTKLLDPYVTLLTAWSIVLYRYSGCSDFLIGIPFTNRRDRRFANSLGCFVNTLPLRIVFEGGDSVEKLLRHVRGAMLGAHRHQELPLDAIARAVSPQRIPGANPLFQVGFTFEHSMPLHLDGLAIEHLPCHAGGAQLDLFLRCWKAPGQYSCKLEYNRHLFDESTAERMLDSLEQAVHCIVEDTRRVIDEVEVLSRQQLKELASFNDNARSYTLRPLHEKFREQVARTPESIAVSYQTKTLSYRELDTSSNQMARALLRKGVSRGDFVAIRMDRSLDLIIAIYAVLKAGAAYVPIETNCPAARVATIIEDCGAGVLIGDDEPLPTLPGADRPTFINGTDPAFYSRESAEPLDVGVDLCDIAYMIYTSGSTGEPKGVLNTHRGVANRLCWMQDAFRIDASDRVLQKTPISFDVSVWELFWPLQVGARLVVAPAEAHRDPASLCELMKREAISTVHFVPSMLETLLSADWGFDGGGLKHVISSGEALSSELQEIFFEKLPGVKLHNLYGPTEAAIDVTHWACSPDFAGPRVPIGKAIANVQIHILDRRLRRVPIGMAGEICIGGVQVAAGYWRREKLTRERFVRDPFANVEGAQLYRTGDLGRYLPSGDIEFLGRLDYQVKIRGNRIELGEIESVLRTHAGVSQAVAMAREVANRRQQLLAYVVAREGKTCVSSELRTHLAKRLPEYMIPACFILLRELPTLPNGKLDRSALPAPRAKENAQPEEHAAPRTETEKFLYRAWRREFSTESIGVDRNFFDAGGDSLMLIRVFASLRERYGDELSLVKLFEYPTIESLARYLDRKPGEFDDHEARARDRAQRARAAFSRRRRTMGQR